MSSDANHRLLVTIPVYNEAPCIASVIHEVRSYANRADIVVINDGSSDGSASIARDAGAEVIDLPFNLGIGGAVQTGLMFAAERDYDLVARLDGDGQHNAAQLAQLIRPVISGEADVVIGSRFIEGRGYTSSLARAIGMRVFSGVVALVTGHHFTDTTSGFQVLNRAAACFLASHLPTDYPEIEGLVLLCRAGFRVCEVAVTMRPRIAGRSSISPWRAIYYICKVSLAVLIGRVRRLPKKPEV
jgi:glycosyltransferase involved in cell wall biosynthesis